MTSSDASTIRLRALEPNDLDLLFTIENDTRLWHISTTNMPYSREWLREFILSTTGDIYTDKQLHLVIELTPADGSVPTVIGIVDLLDFDPRNSRAEIGIVVLDAFRGHGYASTAIERIVNYAKNFLNIHQLYAVIPADNNASRHLFRHCGFTECAEIREWLFDGNGYKPAIFVQKMLHDA